MSVALEPRPTGLRTPSGNGGAPARRAVVRWSWRLFRREWRQQLLVLTLLTVAVAATTVGLAVATTATRAPQTTATLPGSDPQLEADIAAMRQAFGAVTVIPHRRVPVPGSVATIDLRAQDTHGSHPTLRLLSGRFPAGTNEVAVTHHVADVFDLRIGATWHESGRARQVVGLVENPRDLHDQFALVAPGQAEPAATVGVLLHANPQSFGGVPLPSGTPLSIEAESAAAKSAAAAAVLALGTIAMLFVGLVAVAGFTLMAQRRLRALGMLGSLGATDRHVRLVMLANGAAVGAGAAAVGGAVGLAAWVVSAPRLETIVAHRIDRFALPWWAIGVAMVLAVVTAVAAAWWPARSASRISVVAALSGRPPRPQPAHRFAALGGVVLVAGVALLALAHQRHLFLVFTGTVATTVGLLLLAPLAIRALPVVGRRSRIGIRLALRDLARYQARSGAALGAITLAVGIAATIAVSAAAQAAPNPATGGNLASNQLVAYLGAGGADGPVPEQSPAQLQASQNRVDAIATSLRTHDVVTLDVATNPNAPTLPGLGRGEGGKPPAGLVKVTRQRDGENVKLIAKLYIATPDLLARFRIDARHIDPNADLLTARTDLAGLSIGSGLRQQVAPKTQHVDLPRYSSGPNTLITTRAVQRLGLQVVPFGWLVQTARPLTTAQIGAARKLAAAAGLTIETRSTQSSLNQLGTDATAAGVLLALGVLAMTVGLIRSETAHDLRTLTATGASSGTRRTLTGATAGALALLGAVLGTAGAYLALVAWYRSDLHALTNVPVRNLAALVVGLPLTAAVAGWLLAGREPPAIARQPLE